MFPPPYDAKNVAAQGHWSFGMGLKPAQDPWPGAEMAAHHFNNRPLAWISGATNGGTPVTTRLARNATTLVTMKDRREEIPDGAFFARDGWIEETGPSSELPSSADQVLDLSGQVVVPGLVNTHHHFYQTLTRAIAQNSPLFDWLTTLYPIWARMTPDDVRVSTKTALIELAMSGCTTSSDHLYLFPNGSTLEDEIEPARELGMRFHAAHGSMSLGQSEGGLPPDSVVETADAILAESERLDLQLALAAPVGARADASLVRGFEEIASPCRAVI